MGNSKNPYVDRFVFDFKLPKRDQYFVSHFPPQEAGGNLEFYPSDRRKPLTDEDSKQYKEASRKQESFFKLRELLLQFGTAYPWGIPGDDNYDRIFEGEIDNALIPILERQDRERNLNDFFKSRNT